MKWNANFAFRKSTTARRDESGFLIEGATSELVEGSFCQVDRSGKDDQIISQDGQEYKSTYTVYMEPKWANILEIGDTLKITTIRNQVIEKNIIGTDPTDKMSFVAWL